MKYFKLASIAAGIAFASNALAQNAPEASTLVGHTYGGLHYTYFLADDERYNFNSIPASSLDDGNGFGAELGYRFSELNELRIKFTDLKVDAHRDMYGEENGTSTAIDLLHFPSKQNLYLVGGFKRINLDKAEVSANAGMGYRHYFTNRFAAYVEGKMHYEFERDYKDFTTSIGVMYFFGNNTASNKPAIVKQKPAATQVPQKFAEQKVIDKDTDKDGVINEKDKCPNTPKTHMVDNLGCTVFSQTVQSMQLQINFDNNSAEIKSDYSGQLDKAASFLSRYPQANLTIEGHTSAVGSATYNEVLSLKRAQAVVDKLVSEYGISTNRLTAVGYGEERLLNNANTSAAHAENRRIMATVEVREKVAVSKK